MSTIATTPAPLALPFRKGDTVTYTAPGGKESWTTKVRRVVNVKGATQVIRYYSLEGAAGVLVPADRLQHVWEA